MQFKNLLVAGMVGLCGLPFMGFGITPFTGYPDDRTANQKEQHMRLLLQAQESGMKRAIEEDRREGFFKSGNLPALEELAKQGDSVALYYLASLLMTVCYLDNGAPQDYTKAYALMSVAAAQGVREAETAQAFIMQSMTPEQAAEGQRLSREYAEKYMKK